jgi:hypothetical protein
MVAAERDDVAFLVLLAAPGIRGDELLYLQAARLAKAGGAPAFAVAANRKLQERLFAVLRSEADPDAARGELAELLAPLGEAAANAQLDMVGSAWFRFFVNHDPAPVLRAVACPVLALGGSLDLQVPPDENLGAIAAALEAGRTPTSR